MRKEIDEQFIAWDKVRKQLFEIANWSNSPDGEFQLISESGEILKAKDKDVLALMNSGKKDKEGNPIYDGYIVVSQSSDQRIQIGFGDNPGYRPDNPYSEFYFVTEGCHRMALEKLEDKVIIIGNIYENPELAIEPVESCIQEG